jgi:hypothetical protein
LQVNYVSFGVFDGDNDIIDIASQVDLSEDLALGDRDAIEVKLHIVELSIVGHDVDACHSILILFYSVAVLVPSVSVGAAVSIGCLNVAHLDEFFAVEDVGKLRANTDTDGEVIVLVIGPIGFNSDECL